MTRTADIAATDPVSRMARDIRAVTQDKGDCLEADMRLKGWTDDEIRLHRQPALALVRRWQDREDAARTGDREAARQITPRAARRAVSQVGTVRSHLDFVRGKLDQIGGRTAPMPAGSRVVQRLDLAIAGLTELRAEIAEGPAASIPAPAAA